MGKLKKLAILLVGILASQATYGQVKTSKDTVRSQQAEKPKQEIKNDKNNMMLNAAADNGPRVVNIGLPASVGGTVILENGLPVTYDFMGQLPTTVWRQDNGIGKFEVLNVQNTALFASDVGISVSTWSNRGSDKFKGIVGFTTNTFGLLRADVNISGPIKNNWSYSATAFLNFDPGTFKSNIATYLDNTKIFKFLINKRYTKGQIGIQYKYANSSAINAKQSPYIYRENGKVDALPGFRIGRDAYLEESGSIHAIDPLTGAAVKWDAMDDAGSHSHVIDLLGDHTFNKGLKLDYTLRYQYADVGMYNPYYTDITTAGNTSAAKPGDKRYFLAEDPASAYEGYVQNALMIFAPRASKNTAMARIEISKKSSKHHWVLGLHNWFYQVDKGNNATYSTQFSVEPNPRTLIYQQYTAELGNDGKPTETYQWKNMTDGFGNRSYNRAMQYYNGRENKLAVVATEKWDVNSKLSISLGARAEWQRIDGDWYPGSSRQANGENWVAGHTSNIKKDWLNLTGTAEAVYKAFPQLGTPEKPMSLGFLADLMYIQQAGKLSMYAGADDPNMEKSEIPGGSFGIYFNHPVINIISKVTKIKRTKFKNNSTFNKREADGSITTEKQTIGYDVNTIGWTTDVLLKLFKGFELQALLTLQNPKYENYEFDVFGEHFSNSGNIARSVSKTLVELNPSYSWKRYKLWASARYFSKEFANYPNTLVFAGRWETFAGFSMKVNKNLDFALNAVNLLNQSGAQGSISGTNTTTAEQAKALFDRPLSGTYIRPFTLELKTRYRF
ncbi:hypothetical protein [Sphingobacterium humi]|uniref:TonB-dependent receptor n=1 Tax=Sphingobacterium humi TaxID=1796905 RepID=A0A6N8L330_9SPHI|nr:hypothetical protein [Sphingobacterium humi]MVZ64123.1 hypothetical protein [Sphingobacterium humi]